MFKEERRRTYIYIILRPALGIEVEILFYAQGGTTQSIKKIATDSPTRRGTPSKKKKRKKNKKKTCILKKNRIFAIDLHNVNYITNKK